MFFIFLRTVWYYNAAAVLSLVGISPPFKKLYYAGRSLNKKSFRFPESANSDFLICLKIYKRIFSGILKKEQAFVSLDATSREAIFDTFLADSESRVEYVEKLAGKKIGYVISKNNLLSYESPLQLLLVFIYLLISIIPVGLISIFSRNKLRYPLMILEVVECINLQQIIRKNKIQKVHYFSIYERDANIYSFILMKLDITINKIPSEVPLVFANKVIIANELSFCFAYQQEEFEAFKATMFVKSTRLWAPENYFKTPPRLISPLNKEINSNYDIGFFSSGNWLRVKLGDLDLGRNDKENEEELLRTVVDHATKKNLSLCLFLHPMEKRAANLELSKEYYKIILENSNVQLADLTKPSTEGFDSINLGIAQYSTIMFERLVLGFKTLIAPWGYPEFPLQHSALRNCTALTSEELINKLNANQHLSRQDFFINNKLDKYVFNA